ncbi:MAG: hypothetical protein NC314_12890 [Roseburia sp.]|nr:hypothetical protein [Ruminococcus sp.]MCM1156326.1 hypothetical protein [Roseburia sp.]MCM1243733.1 hypothetical protein [Roseburia sp.]
MILNIIGGLSNAVAAICAVVAIVVTVQNFKSDRQEQKKEKLSSKLRELYKQAIIDDFLKVEDEKIDCINKRLDKMSQTQFDEGAMREISDDMMSELHNCLRKAEIIKLFNRKLYQKIRLITENILDTYSKLINKSMEHRFVSKAFEQQINSQWIELKRSVYECYIEEDFDKSAV